ANVSARRPMDRPPNDSRAGRLPYPQGRRVAVRRHGDYTPDRPREGQPQPLINDGHVVEVRPGALEGGLVDPVLGARPGIVDADLGVAHAAQHNGVLAQRIVDLRVVPGLPDAVPGEDPLVLDPDLDGVPGRDRLVDRARRVAAA